MEYLFRKPTGSPADRGATPPRYRREDGPAGMLIERDVPVPVRGGVTVYPRPLIQALHDDLANRGRHVICSGGEYDSHLLVPVLTA